MSWSVSGVSWNVLGGVLEYLLVLDWRIGEEDSRVGEEDRGKGGNGQIFTSPEASRPEGFWPPGLRASGRCLGRLKASVFLT